MKLVLSHYAGRMIIDLAVENEIRAAVGALEPPADIDIDAIVELARNQDEY
ncbi:MAG: hypothetical protein ACYDAQ_00685 [Mycobacteriales bacterium]